MSAIKPNAITGRLQALQRAVDSRNWDNVRFHLNNVTRGVQRLVEGTRADMVDETWQPLVRSEPNPLSAEKRALLLASGGDQSLIDELNNGEMWVNDLYTVIVTRFGPDSEFLGQVQELSIRRNDRGAVHDWRHFQLIKDQLAGPEIEAFELYPARARLMDTANQYYVYCLPPGHILPVGYQGPTLIRGHDDEGIGQTQRPLPEGWNATYNDVVATAKQKGNHP